MNKLCCKLSLLKLGSFTLGIATSVQAADKQSTKLQPLDAEFLAFIAQMEQVDGDWIDPLTVEKMSTNDLKVATTSNKAVTTDSSNELQNNYEGVK